MTPNCRILLNIVATYGRSLYALEFVHGVPIVFSGAQHARRRTLGQDQRVLSAVGFNLVKLMKGLKKRWLKRLFLYLQAAMDRFAACTAWFIQLAAEENVRPAAILRSQSGRSNWVLHNRLCKESR